MLNAWSKLWELATGLNPADTAKIEVDSDRSDVVVLVYPDGSRGVWYWKGSDWHAAGEANYERNAHSSVGGEGE